LISTSNITFDDTLTSDFTGALPVYVSAVVPR
jgi:hypothetical protein